MNIFILDRDITRCSQYHCDQHVIKMTLESVQILSTVAHKKGYATTYRPTHRNHPCVLWAEGSYDNFLWLRRLALALNDEYRYRFDRQQDHASIAILAELDPVTFESVGLTEFVQAMPERYRVPGDPVQAYRRFYAGEKLDFARWTKRPSPSWLAPLRTKLSGTQSETTPSQDCLS